MIKTRQLDDGFFDEQICNSLVRHYAHTQAVGYVSAINLTPLSVNYSEILNVDLVLSEYPSVIAGRFEFDYANPEKRIAHRAGFGIGAFEHLHLFIDQPTINFLLRHFGKKIHMDGDEIAIQSSGRSWFWQTAKALELLEVSPGSGLHEIVNAAGRARSSSERACHSLFVQVVSDGHEMRLGSGMGGHFAAAAAGVSGYGGQIAKNSLEKARKNLEEKNKQNGMGKSRDSRNTNKQGDES